MKAVCGDSAKERKNMKKRIIMFAAAAAITMPMYGAAAADTYVYDFEDGITDGWNISSADMEVTDSNSPQNSALKITNGTGSKSILKLMFDQTQTDETFVISYAVKPMVITNRFYNILGIQADGITDYSSVVLRHKNDGGLFFDPGGSNNAGTWFCNMAKGNWNYVSLLINNKEHTAKIAYVRSNGSIERDDAIRKTGKFSNKIESGIKGFEIAGDPYSGGDEYWIDDFIVSDISPDSDYKMSPVKTNIENKAIPENKTISLKYPVCFVNKNYAAKDKVKITSVKNGVSADVEDFDIEMTPNTVNINFENDLTANAEYTVSFADSVKNAFNQNLADYTFKTGAKQGTCLVDNVTYYDNDGEVSSDAVPETVSRIDIAYENEMESGFDAVKIADADYVSSYDAERKIQSITFKKALTPFRDYEFVIPADVRDINGNSIEPESHKFSTVKGKYDIKYEITSSGKNVASLDGLTAGDTLDVKAALKGIEGQTTDGYLWVSFYGENKEIKAVCSPVMLNDRNAQGSYIVPEGAKEIRINVTDGKLRPLGKKCIVTGGGISE